MMKDNSYKRNHISYILEEILKSIKSIFIFLILAITNLDEGGVYVIIALIVLSILKAFLKWLTVKFLINNNELIYHTGVINKKRFEIPFDKINTIDISRNIVDRLFNISTLKIDTGAVKEVGEEIKIKVTEIIAYEIRDLINELSNNNINNNVNLSREYNKNKVSKTITTMEIIKYSLSKSKIFWAIGGVFFIGDIIQNLEETLSISITDSVIDNIDIEKVLSVGLFNAFLNILFILIVLYIFISIIYIIFELIRLNNFTVTNDKNDIKIKYGLFTIKEYSIPKDKIYAIRYKQNLLQQFLKIFQIEVVTIGYGDEKNEQAILYPVGDLNFVNSILRPILPSFEFSGEINKPPKKVLSRFLVMRSIILIIFIIIPLCFFIPNRFLLIKISLILLLILYNIFLGYLDYRNTSLGVNKDLLVASSGSNIKITTLIKQEHLQSIEVKENPFQRRKNVCDFKLDIYSNKIGDIVVVKNLNKVLLNTIDKNLIL